MRFKGTVLALLIVTLAASSAAVAQQKAMVWLALSKVNSGMLDDAVGYVLEDKDFMNGLMADGTIYTWGVATRVSHVPGEQHNFVEYVVLPDWEHVDTWAQAAIARMRSQSPEEAAENQAKFEKIFAAGSHSDIVMDSNSWQASGGPPPRYVYASEFYANSGRGGDLTELYHSVIPPIGKKLIEEGLVSGFGLDTPSLHNGDGWTHTAVYFLTGLKAVDRLHQEIENAMTPELAKKAAEMHDFPRHRDSVWMLLHQGGGTGESDETED